VGLDADTIFAEVNNSVLEGLKQATKNIVSTTTRLFYVCVQVTQNDVVAHVVSSLLIWKDD
jgi:ribosomal protein L7Ae-like RNA K-turn-binding protein